MSQTATYQLLPQTSYNGRGNNAPYTVTGEPVTAAAYYLGNRDLQTVNLSVTNFTGNVQIQASLTGSPSGDYDWFQVHNLQANAKAMEGSELYNNSNVNTSTNVVGNFVWLRARVVDFNSGVVNFVKVSY